jgi:hypothetical protein
VASKVLALEFTPEPENVNSPPPILAESPNEVKSTAVSFSQTSTGDKKLRISGVGFRVIVKLVVVGDVQTAFDAETVIVVTISLVVLFEPAINVMLSDPLEGLPTDVLSDVQLILSFPERVEKSISISSPEHTAMSDGTGENTGVGVMVKTISSLASAQIPKAVVTVLVKVTDPVELSVAPGV